MPRPIAAASALSRDSERAIPNFFSGSVSPDRPDRRASRASSVLTLLNDARSAARPTSDVLISVAIGCVRPNACSRFPYVPAASRAACSEIPSDCALVLAKSRTALDESPNTTSTLLSDSCRSDPMSMNFFADTAAAVPSAAVARPIVFRDGRALDMRLPMLTVASPVSFSALTADFALPKICRVSLRAPAMISAVYSGNASPVSRSSTV